MSVDLFDGPLTGRVDPSLLAQLQTVEDRLKSTSTAVQGWATRWSQAAAPMVTVAQGISSVAQSAVAAAQSVWQLSQHIAQLATEQANLDRNSARLGLDFDAAAEAAGRFTDETEVMAAATRASAAGVRLSQQELTALTQVAARYSQDTGKSMAESFEALTSGVLHGTRGLRDFGPALSALQGPAHTAGERLQALVEHAQHITPATDDATTAMARFQDTIEDGERTMASAFVAEIARIHEMSTALDGATSDATEMNAQLRAAGATAAALTYGLGNLGLALAGVLGGAFVVVLRPMQQSLRALMALREGNIRGAVGALASVGDTTSEDLSSIRSFVGDRLRGAQTALGQLGAGEQTREGLGEVTPQSMTFSEAEVRQLDEDAAARRQRGGGRGGGREDPRLTRLWARSNATKLAEDERMALLTGQNRAPGTGPIADDLRDLTGGVSGAFDDSAQRALDAANVRNAESLREAAHRDYENRISTRLQGDQESPEARAARDIAGAWGDATNALGAHLGLLASGQETWGDFWEGVAKAGRKAIAEAASNEGKIEYGRALAALAVGNFPGAALHFAAGTALTGLGAALGAAGGGGQPTGAGGGRGASPRSERAADVGSRQDAGRGGPVTLTVNFGGASFYGAGGPRQAAAELVDLLNRSGHLSGATLDRRLLPA